jgi:4-hydroxy-tetrahydrodipicolinate reductase
VRIAILGYGRMGREVEQAAAAHGHQVVITIDRDNLSDFNRESISACDVAVEFTGPEAAADTIIRAINLGLPVVSGSTGWLDRYEEVASLCLEKNGSFIHASNFSVGVNILFRINAELARIMSSLPEYKAVIEEIHHIYKLDTPSGTAITLAGTISEQHHSYDGWKKDDDEAEEKKISVRSVREGNVPGTHAVTWKSRNDTITIRHEAFNRRGFAEGALMAAGYIVTRKGVFTMSDVLSL